jgi:hypothetical protein
LPAIQVFELEESPLSYFERWIQSEVCPNLKQLNNLATLLKSRGAAQRRDCRRIFHYETYQTRYGTRSEPAICYQLLQEESGCLLESWSGDVETLGQAAEDMKETFAEPIILDESTRALTEFYKAVNPSAILNFREI